MKSMSLSIAMAMGLVSLIPDSLAKMGWMKNEDENHARESRNAMKK